MGSEQSEARRELFLGVDGGGTKTSCYLGALDENLSLCVLGRGLSSGSNPNTVGMDKAVAAILESVERAQQDAGIIGQFCCRGLFAVAGTLNMDVRRELAARLSEGGIAAKCDVVPDLYPLLETGSKDSAAVGLIAGTGSVGIGRNAAGEIALAGGWGPLVGDDGSGFALGKDAIRHAFNQLEQGAAADRLTEVVCQQLGASTATEIRAKLAAAADQRSLIAQLAKVVVSEAVEGDRSASSIISKGVFYLTELVKHLRTRLKLGEAPLTINVSGGLFQQSDYYCGRLKEMLGEAGVACQIHLLDDPTFICLTIAARADFDGEIRLLP
ncbi:BadF/BadG/BcrA/BcrD ATPase family protein [Blastopirellula marina]|uniref:ATPase BadF/BadG/BcrA/BcrD type domain-containing protein n=1 Tax=Blastopirellula marina TaxID=124 RepID=A0A2S8GMQ2_9BACT|nr:BadF/BadG/BcrA/BcrD ATPase family protein [Blastopirellula marina]PQO45698.1 hypothetical protein C5Y93_12265 [Blastopirellula marina]